MKRALKILGILILILLVVALVLPFVVNVNAFRPTLESNLSSALGRQVKVGNLKLSILSGSVAAENISIADDPAFSNAPFVKAKSLAVGVELIPLIFSKALHVTDLTLERPQISLLHSPSGKWNFSSIGAASGKTAPAAGAKSGGAAEQNLTVNQLTVSDGRVQVAKVPSSAKPLVFDKVNISVRNFSFTSQFPFTLAANLPGGGGANLDGKAGPMNATDAAQTPLQARLKVSRLNLAESGFVDPSAGIGGLADFDGALNSDGRQVHTAGTVKADKLKLVQKGSPAGRPVEVKYALEHNLQRESGTLTQGDVAMGKAVAHLTGSYQMQGDTTSLNMKLVGQGMPVDDLEAMLPAMGVVLPSGSSLKGGTLSANLGIAGPLDKLVITGPVRLADTRLAGFDMGSKMSAISALSGAKTGSDTSIQNLSTDARVAPEGIRTDNISLIIPSIGQLSGNGTISPGGALDYKMTAKLTGGAVAGLSQVAGLGGKSGGAIPFFIRGTTSDPSFVPDVKGMLSGQLKSNLPVNPSQKNAIDAISGMFKKKKNK
jgi:AsmA protein